MKVQADYYYSTCEKCGEKVHNDEMSQYDHDRYECGLTVDAWLVECEPWSMRTAYATVGNGVAWIIDRAYPIKGTVTAHMVGDDQPHTLNISELSPLDGSDFCHECGQTDCSWHAYEDHD